MNTPTRHALGASGWLAIFPAAAQTAAPTAATSASTAVDCKPCTQQAQIIPPTGPTWLVVALALVVGLVVGYALARMLGRGAASR